jgi:hypothetical protein
MSVLFNFHVRHSQLQPDIAHLVLTWIRFLLLVLDTFLVHDHCLGVVSQLHVNHANVKTNLGGDPRGYIDRVHAVDYAKR